MESKKINQLATELTPALSDLTIIGDPTTGISKKITLSQMASLFTGTVEEYANLASFPLVGTADTIYIALDTNVIYRWNTGTSAYVELSPNIVTSLVFSDANGFDGTISLVGSTATLTITTALTQGSVPFIGASGALSQDNANLFFDDTNNRLGINTNAPTTALDVFGSGIIGRLNGTSTNNSYLGFASGGTNQWSIGNVQSDQRFRIYSEANTSELVSVLQTGEFGIGIANPTTKFHIDGGASALIANLDANISVAKSISFRSDNSNRINLEVSGTESGSNAGANLYINRYSDAGALIDTALQITRSTGVTTIKQLGILNSGNIYFQFNTTNSTGAYGTFEVSGSVFGDIGYGSQLFSGGGTAFGINARDSRSLILGTNQAIRLTISSTGQATFTNSVTATQLIGYGSRPQGLFTTNNSTGLVIRDATGTGYKSWSIGTNDIVAGFAITPSTAVGGTTFTTPAFLIDESSRIGVGTNSPSEKLDVIGGAVAAGNGTIKTGITYGTYGLIGTFTNHDLGIITNGAEKIRLLTGGEVRITSRYLSVTNEVTNEIGVWVKGVGTYSSGYASIQSFASAITYDTKLVLQENGGTVLIGTTTSPSAYGKLIIRGANQGLTIQDSVSNGYRSAYFQSGNLYFFNGTNEGYLSSGGTWVNASDISIKKDIKEIEYGINEVMALKPKWYRMIDDDIEQIGFIAQEVEEVLPELVSTSERGMKGLSYGQMTAVLVKAMQEQQKQIEELKALINK